MLIAGDIGGTKTTLALFRRDQPRTPERQVTYPTRAYADLPTMVATFLPDRAGPIRGAVFAVAGPVVGGRARVTSLSRSLSEAELRDALRLPWVRLVNDLQATAYGLTVLHPEDLHPLHDVPPGDGPRAVVAPGTGLGESVLIRNGSCHLAIASEGGHADFAPADDLQIELLRHLRHRFGHVSYERVCSGSALPDLYHFLKRHHPGGEPAATRSALAAAADPTPVIVGRALSGACPVCSAVLDLFVSILGAEAGNLALKVMATGGIYLGGGLPPKILAKLGEGSFLAAFTRKGRLSDPLRQIPVHVILNEHTALLGAAAYGMEEGGSDA